MEEIAVVEVGLQEGVRDDGSTWSRWKVKDGNNRTLSYFQNAKTEGWPKIFVQGKHARVEIETKDLGGGRTVNNIVAVEAIENGSMPEAYTKQTMAGTNWDKKDLEIARQAIWKSYLEGVASSLYAKVVSDNAKAEPNSQRDPIDYVLITGARIVVAAERDIFERPPGDDAIPFKTAGDE